MFRLSLLTIAQIVAIGAACAQTPKGESKPIDKPIDLMAPRLVSEGITFYVGKILYRGGQIVSADADGKNVAIKTASGALTVEWAKLSADTRQKFQAEYDLAVAKAVRDVERAKDEAERAKDAADGIVFISGKIINIPDDGLLLEDDSGLVVFLTGHPQQSGLADGDSVSCRAKPAGVFKYGSIWEGRKTVRSYKYIRE